MLFGLNYYFDAGYEIENFTPSKKKQIPLFYKIVNTLFFFLNLGDLSLQFEILKREKEFDIVFAACDGLLHYLQFLRYKKKFSLPIVILQHHIIHNGRADLLRKTFNRKCYRGLSACVCLSSNVANNIASKTNIKTFSINWGTDIDFYKNHSLRGDGLIVAGRTSRDFETVIKALETSSSRGKIYCLESEYKYEGKLPSNIKLVKSVNKQPVPGKNVGWVKLNRIIEDYQKARVIGIPLFAQKTLVGLTSLMDCMGMGKPVIMTRNQNIDLDIEKEGIGHWVEPGDVDHWRYLINWYQNNGQKAWEMGCRARKLAEDRYNSNNFAKELMSLFERLVK